MTMAEIISEYSKSSASVVYEPPPVTEMRISYRPYRKISHTERQARAAMMNFYSRNFDRFNRRIPGNLDRDFTNVPAISFPSAARAAGES
jgi:hypothetical protein